MAKRDRRIMVHRNQTNIGMVGNFHAALQGPTSQYMLMLMSDDLLRADAIERMVKVIGSNDNIQLVAARNVMISYRKALLPARAEAAIRQQFEGCTRGRDVAREVLRRTSNFVGEPSCVMFRLPSKRLERTNMLRYGGLFDYYCNVDVSMWLSLLAKGDAYIMQDPLVAVREHSGREQHNSFAAVAGAREWFYLIAAARDAGTLDDQDYDEAICSARAVGEVILDRLKSTTNPPLLTDLKQLHDLVKGRYS